MDTTQKITLVDEPPSPTPVPPRAQGIRFPRKRDGEPDHYCLPTAGTLGVPRSRAVPHETIRFWFRTRLVTAQAEPVVPLQQNILRLHLGPSRAQRIINLVASIVPRWIRSCFRAIFPEWSLPDRIILKRQRMGKDEENGDPEELMNTEIRAYQRLRRVQSARIPTYYGKVSLDSSSAILLEDVGGASLDEPEGSLLDLKTLSELLEECHRSLWPGGVSHEDAQLNNFLLVDGKIIAVDLEEAGFDVAPKDVEEFMCNDISRILHLYRDNRAYLRNEGLLEAA